jgi:hypothetical protein
MNDTTKTYDLAKLIQKGRRETGRCTKNYIEHENGTIKTCVLGAAIYALRTLGTKRRPKALVLQELGAKIHERQLPSDLSTLGFEEGKGPEVPLWAVLERMNDVLEMSRGSVEAWLKACVPKEKRTISVTLMRAPGGTRGPVDPPKRPAPVAA